MAILATAVWRVRPSGNNLNGGGYDTGIAGAATDYSQQNTAQATGTNGATTGAGATTFTDSTAGAFTSAMVGNCIQIASGTNFQAGFYFVVTFTNANSVVLDRTPSSGGAGSGGVWKLGGGWSDFWTNTISTGPLVSENIVYILGSGTPNPAAYTYDYDATTNFTPITHVLFANDPGTPGYKVPPDTTGGMPVIKFDVASSLLTTSNSDNILHGLWFVGTTTAAGNYVVSIANYAMAFIGCVLDQFGKDVGLATSGGNCTVIGCEIFSSAAGGVGSLAAVYSTGDFLITGCNIHNCIGIGAVTFGAVHGRIINSIIAKCQSDGIQLSGYVGSSVQNCTIDGNLGSGINFTTTGRQQYIPVFNCIISNHTGGGTFGVTSAGAARGQFFDYNVYYNNTSDLNNLVYGPHDTHGGANPYVGSGTENYTLG